MTCRTVAIPMTLNDHQGHLTIRAFSNGIFAQLSSGWQELNWHHVSRGPSAIAELLLLCIMFVNRPSDFKFLFSFLIAVMSLFSLKPRPHQQRCRSNLQLRRKNRSNCSLAFDNVASILLLVWTRHYVKLFTGKTNCFTCFMAASCLQPLKLGNQRNYRSV